jgi:membrane-associated phospholipid phosphatase
MIDGRRTSSFNADLKVVVGLTIVSGLTFILVDRPLAMALADQPDWVKSVAFMTSRVTGPGVVLPILIGLTAADWLRQLRPVRTAKPIGLFLFPSALAAVIGSVVVKNVIGRARPSVLTDWNPTLFNPLALSDAFASLPSSQATMAAALAFAMAARFRNSGAVFIVLGAIIGTSRIAVGEHWASDVVAGWALGWLIVRLLVRKSSN